jgi:hypothetical protein
MPLEAALSSSKGPVPFSPLCVIVGTSGINYAYYKLLCEKMLHKGLITQKDFGALSPRVELKGSAEWVVLPPDSIPPVSVNLDYSEETRASSEIQ